MNQPAFLALKRRICFVSIVCASIFCFPFESFAQAAVGKGLMLDLDADKGVELDDSGRVVIWTNQVPGTTVKVFVPRDEGRPVAGSGRPGYQRDIAAINHHPTLVFREQELLNSDEDAFDHLITGSGYTFFCVLRPYSQEGKLKDVNSFFGNLRNGGNYEGIWGGLADDNRVWSGARNGITFGRWDDNNPFIVSAASLDTTHYYLVMGRMDAGTDSANVCLMVGGDTASYCRRVKVNPKADPSKLSIGQERDAIQHPGVESFDGEIARFLLYDRPLNTSEMRAVTDRLNARYRLATGR